MIWFALAVAVFLLVGILFCVKYDAPEHYAAFKRIVFGGTLALMLAVGAAKLYAAELQPLTCNDLEKYSLLWYANFCFWNEGSH